MSLAPGKSPFKFLDSYGADDQAIFFGRDREVEEVYDKVFQSKLLLVYGASGTGKSSIINCGLANKFDESDWFPIRIRRGGNIRRSLFNQIEKEAIQKVDLPDQEKTTNEGLQKVVNSVYLDHFKPIYLIFDQFEELFIFGFKDEWKEFISSIRFLMDTDLDLHFIFIIRGEYLEFLSEFEELIPEFFDNRIRVEKMTRKKAEETITGPAEEHGIAIEQGFEDRLLKKLSPEKSQIELTFLQVFLDKIYKTAVGTSDSSVTFTTDQIEKLGQLGDVLAEFVDEQLFQMEDPKAALTVLKSFVSLQGTKVQNTVREVVSYCMDLGLPLSEKAVDEILQSFVNKRILKDHDDNGKYELRHDSLAQKIFEKITNQEKELLDVKQFLNYSLNEFQKRGTLLSDDDLGYVAFYERNLEIDSEMKEFIQLSKKNSSKRLRERKTRTVIITIILALLVTSVFGFFYSQTQKQRAEDLAMLAETARANAENQKEIAEDQREIALQNEQKANEQAQLATEQRLLADQAKVEANAQRNLALEQKSIAEQERILAEQAREAAQTSEDQALTQKEIAEEQRSLALRLRTLSLAKELAIKSTYMADQELKSLLSLQAFQFNLENEGDPYDPDIYQSLYLSRKANFGDGNTSQAHTSVVTDILEIAGQRYSIGNDGKLITYPNNTPSVLFDSEYAFETFAQINAEVIAIGTQNGTLLLFDLTRQMVIAQRQIHSSDITAIQSMDNSIITSSLDGKIIYSDIKDLTPSLVKNIEEPIRDMLLTEKQVWFVSGGDRLSQLIDDTIRSFVPLSGATLTSMAYETESGSFYLGTESGDLVTWSAANQK